MDKITEIMNQLTMAMMEQDIEMGKISEVKNVMEIVLNKYNIEDKLNEVIVYDESNDFYLNLYLRTKLLEGKTQKTVDRYKYELTRMLDFLYNVKIKDMNVFHLRKYLDNMKNVKHNSNTTIDNTRRCFTSFFTWLYNEELIEKNPTKKLGVIKNDTVKEEALTVREIELLMIYAKNDREKAMIQFFLDTGCRISEIVGINLVDINIKEKSCIVTGKGDKVRRVYFTDKSVVYLERYIKDRQGGSLFLSERSKLGLSKDGMYEVFRRIAKRASVNNLHPHRFRVTMISKLANRGVTLSNLAKIVGHNDINTTNGYCRSSNNQIMLDYNKAV